MRLFALVIASSLLPFAFLAENSTELATGRQFSLKNVARERRILQKKRRKMKELREEIRVLSLQLAEQGSSTRAESRQRPSRPLMNSDDLERNWKPILLEKLRSILRRLTRLERQIGKLQRGRNRKNDKIFERDPVRKMTNGIVQQDFAVCLQHQHCRPGFCCVTKEDNTKRCQELQLKVNQTCSDSCQCAPTLSCYRPKGQDAAFCKNPSRDDVKLGEYRSRPNVTLTHKIPD